MNTKSDKYTYCFARHVQRRPFRNAKAQETTALSNGIRLHTGQSVVEAVTAYYSGYIFPIFNHNKSAKEARRTEPEIVHGSPADLSFRK